MSRAWKGKTMFKSTVVIPLVRGLLVGAAAVALVGTAQAQTRIGVTQSTENNPIGKPPVGSDRVLKVGTDIQASETVTTTSNDRAHLIFLDGTTLTVGPNSRLTIDKFVYDPTSQKGELAVNAASGVFRVIGGRISKTSEVVVKTPSSTLGIRGGIMVVSVGGGMTSSIFVFGNTMTVTANGVTQTVTVPGLQVSTTTGSAPSPASFVVQGNLNAALANLVGNAKAGAATMAAVDALVASNLGNGVTLAAVIQAIVDANAPQALTGSNTTTTVTVVTTENPNQTQASPN